MASHIAALETLGQPTDQWDTWLITVIPRKLDLETGHEWQLRQKNTDLQKYEVVEIFLASRCTAFETSESWSGSKSETIAGSNMKRLTYEARGKRAIVASRVAEHNVCHCCKGVHKIFACDTFKNLTASERITTLHLNRISLF